MDYELRRKLDGLEGDLGYLRYLADLETHLQALVKLQERLLEETVSIGKRVGRIERDMNDR